MLRSNPLSLFDELLQPYKYGPRIYDNDVGTEEDPSIIVRNEMVQKKYKAWREPDGSYHEVLFEDGITLPTKPEITD